MLLLAVLVGACASPAVTRQEGARLFQEQRCLVCHGPEGHGDGERAGAFNPPPRDFRDLRAYRQGADAGAIAETVRTGVRGAQMPSFSHLSKRERLALGAFVVSLQKRELPGDR